MTGRRLVRVLTVWATSVAAWLVVTGLYFLARFYGTQDTADWARRDAGHVACERRRIWNAFLRRPHVDRSPGGTGAFALHIVSTWVGRVHTDFGNVRLAVIAGADPGSLCAS